jgi:uncharacterized protein
MDPGGATVNRAGTVLAAIALALSLASASASGSVVNVLGRFVVPAEPFDVEEVAFVAGDATLVGHLSWPRGEGPHPAAVLIAGSGAQDRDGLNPGLPGYLPLRWLAEHLSGVGFAVLRWDERGVGASTGDHAAATTADLAADVGAGLAFLRAHPGVDASRVGVIGHSEGGVIAARVAAQDRDAIAFVVSLAGPTVPYAEGVVKQVERIQAAGGADTETVADAVREQTRMVELALVEDWAGLEGYLTELTLELAAAWPEPRRERIGDLEAYAAERARAGTDAFRSPWMRYFLPYDPAEAWSRVTVPVLAVFADRDVQVDLEQNLPPLESALAAAGNRDLTVMVFRGANHLFQRADSGHVDEYLRLEMAFMPGFLESISTWLSERFLP